MLKNEQRGLMDSMLPNGPPAAAGNPPMQLWGGMECTVNRVGDAFNDQSVWSSHGNHNPTDWEAVASLGIKTFRTGLLWEHFEATGSWERSDVMLATMQRLGLHPVAGLVHHGSGPVHTSLIDRDFPEKLAAYALEVAQRYPWLADYTPVNEPHTTARFSCLYGHWYPHHRSMGSYLRALLLQIKGIVLSMRAIRTVQPAARLIHTEDGGRFFSSPALESFRMEREHRRWLGTDLLCGTVTRQHPVFPLLREQGIDESEIFWFAGNPCPPDVLGLNYYVTSDRYLDDRLDLYPPHYPGGDSGREPLVDIEAVRVNHGAEISVEAMLRDAWDRYHLPLAVSEAHLGGPPADQIRWLAGVWRQAGAARQSGADVRAVTVWALLGSCNWCNLCTEDVANYEPGVFDVSQGAAELTAYGDFVKCLARHGITGHEALRESGWWARPGRVLY